MSVQTQIDRLNAVKERIRVNLAAQGVAVPAASTLDEMAALILNVAGYTPIKGVDYWTPADQEQIVQDVIKALGTPVFGRVENDNTLILSGNLADGTYHIKYENADGKLSDVCDYVVGTVIEDVPLSWALGTKLDKSTGKVTETGSTTYAATQYIDIIAGKTYVVQRDSNAAKYSSCSVCWYNASDTLVSYTANFFETGAPVTYQLEIPSNATKFRLRMFYDNTGSTMADVAAGYSMTRE